MRRLICQNLCDAMLCWVESLRGRWLQVDNTRLTCFGDYQATGGANFTLQVQVQHQQTIALMNLVLAIHFGCILMCHILSLIGTKRDCEFDTVARYYTVFGSFWQVSNFRLTPIFIALTWFVSRMIVMSLYYVRSVSVAWCYFQDLSDYNRLENLPLDIEWHAFSGTWRLLFRQRATGPCKPSPEKLVWKTLNVWESIRDACLWCSALQTFCCEKNMFGETWCIIGR